MRRVLAASTALLVIATAPVAAQVHPGAGYPMPGPRGAPGAPPMGGMHGGGMRGGGAHGGGYGGVRGGGVVVGGWSGGNAGGSWAQGGRGGGFVSGAHGRSRWGGLIGGHWYAGVTAPGGWSAYHRLHKGSHLTPYWLSPGFYINDYDAYGLASPPPGFLWTRYYDDAVLIDGNGYVWDTVRDLDWARYEGEMAAYDEGYEDGRADGPVAPGPRGFAPPPAYSALPPPPVNYGPAPRVTYGAVTSGSEVYAGGGTVVTVTPGVTTTTTTTTTTEYVEESAARRVVKKRMWRAPPPCTCVAPRPPVRRWHKAAPPILGS